MRKRPNAGQNRLPARLKLARSPDRTVSDPRIQAFATGISNAFSHFMNSESLRIADQLRRAFTGDPWHGSPLLDLLAGITVEKACARPLRSVHSIWELVVHIDVYLQVALEATQGVPAPKLYGTEKDWPPLQDDSAAAWAAAEDRMFQNAEKLVQTIEKFDDAKLQATVPGRPYDFYYLFHGIVQHSLYHAGQIAVLKKALSAA